MGGVEKNAPGGKLLRFALVITGFGGWFEVNCSSVFLKVLKLTCEKSVIVSASIFQAMTCLKLNKKALKLLCPVCSRVTIKTSECRSNIILVNF